MFALLLAIQKAPEWITKGSWIDEKAGKIYFVGMAEGKSIKVAREQAIAAARSLAASSIASKVQSIYFAKSHAKSSGPSEKEIHRELEVQSASYLVGFRPEGFYIKKERPKAEVYVFCSMPLKKYKEAIEEISNRLKVGEINYWAKYTAKRLGSIFKNVSFKIGDFIRTDTGISGNIGRYFRDALLEELSSYKTFTIKKGLSRLTISGVYNSGKISWNFRVYVKESNQIKETVCFKMSKLLVDIEDLPPEVEKLNPALKKLWRENHNITAFTNFGEIYPAVHFGEKLEIFVDVPSPGFLYVFYIDSLGKVTPLPTWMGKRITKGVVKIPSKEDNFSLEFSPPAGVDLIKIFFSPVKIPVKTENLSLLNVIKFAKKVRKIKNYGECSIVISVLPKKLK